MPTNPPRTISGFDVLIRRARQAAGLTQEQLAERAGVSARTISDIERAVFRAPHRMTLELIADALEISEHEREEWSRIHRVRTQRDRETATRATTDRSRGQTRLPSIPTSFVGRTEEIQSLTRLVRSPGVRLVTLTGTGGVGKTRLALVVARNIADRFRDGAKFVDLAPVTDPDLVLPAIAIVLNVQTSSTRPVDVALATYLQHAQLLLLLDNFEQVVKAAPHVGYLMAMCPGLTILVTSRVPLHLRAEHEYPVPPLSVPVLNGRAPVLENLLESDAVSLFLQRTRAVRPDFAISQETAPATIELCRRLGGVPLMIELAAARLRSLPVEEILSRLDRSLALLTARTRDAPERQQTLRATIEWSYNLLSPEEQRIFRTIGVVHGGASLGSIAAVTGVRDELAALDVVESLIEHGLLQQTSGEDGSLRYTMLEGLREYALEQLRVVGEYDEARDRHTAYFVNLAAEARDHLQVADQEIWIARLEEEQNNLRATFEWLEVRAEAGSQESMLDELRLCTSLWWFWFVRGYLREGYPRLERAIARGRTALTCLGDEPERFDFARVFADALVAFATIAFWLTEYDYAKALLEESRALSETLDDEHGVAVAIVFQAYAFSRTGDQEHAQLLLEEGVARHSARNDPQGVALALLGFGEMALRRGDYAYGEERMRECLALYADLGDSRSVTAAKATIGALRLCQGDVEQASVLLRESLVERHRIGDKGGVAWTLEWLARLILSEFPAPEGPRRSAKLLGAARQLRDLTGSEMDPADWPSYNTVLASVQRQLTDTAFVVAWEAGRGMTLEQVAAFGLEDGLALEHRSTIDESTRPALTQREREVLLLIADGLSDREIADKLTISPRTVNTHVVHILNKLGVMSRTAAATKAVRVGVI